MDSADLVEIVVVVVAAAVAYRLAFAA